MILVPLALSTFTHFWNPGGFPDIFYDEGVYMRRTMHLLEGQGPQEGSFYDHPYFGQFFLAGFLGLVGYPGSINPTSSPESIHALYSVPRILMGLLAVADTFLIFKLSEKRYGMRVAFISSVLFAIMPVTWILRRILLDTILLPFLLTSILFAVYAKETTARRRIILVLLSGVFLGTAIFTKIPAFTMIPLVAYLIYSVNAERKRHLIVWFMPVILIPFLWPAYALTQGQFDDWARDVVWQTQRQTAGLGSIIASFFLSDPLTLILGAVGLTYAAIRKDWFLVLWIVPFLVFLAAIGYVQYFYWVPVLPAFFIGSALLLDRLTSRMPKAEYLVISAIGLFGLVSTVLLITVDATSAQYAAAAFVADYADAETTIAASPGYSWLFIYVFDKEHALTDYRDLLFYPMPTERLILVYDRHLEANLVNGTKLHEAYEATETIRTFKGDVTNYESWKYPYTNLIWNFEGSSITVRETN